jgi:predicted phosphatase
VKKDEQNDILDDLWDAVNVDEFKESVKEISHLITKDSQIRLMKLLVNGLPTSCAYLEEAVNNAIADCK